MKKKIYNLANLNKIEREKIKVDLSASMIAFKERHNMVVSVDQIKLEHPVQLRDYFCHRVEFYRKISQKVSFLFHKKKIMCEKF